MPNYCFKCPGCGRLETFSLAIEDRNHPIRCPDCGQVLKRDLQGEHGAFRNTPGNWPLYSDAAGVNPDQIPEAVAEARRCGVPTDFTSDGCAIFTDPAHRRRYCEAHGLYDRNGGYGDPQRR